MLLTFSSKSDKKSHKNVFFYKTVSFQPQAFFKPTGFKQYTS